MPLYTHQCKKHGTFDVVRTISHCDDPENCPMCGRKSKKIIQLGHGGIFRTGDSVQWVRDAAKVLTDDDHPNPNIETVNDLRNYYAAHPNIVPAESHPAFPSSMGDKIQKPDLVAERKKRSKLGREKLREMRSITVGRA